MGNLASRECLSAGGTPVMIESEGDHRETRDARIQTWGVQIAEALGD
jgi:hypothetical protein